MDTHTIGNKEYCAESKYIFFNYDQGINFQIFDLGLTDFEKFLIFQKKILNQIINEELKGAFILCQHNPVITIGRSGSKNDLLVDETELIKKSIKVFKVERGGKLTYHGLGQLLIYPILDLNYFKKDIYYFLRWLEELIIQILKEFAVTAERRQGFTGVWVNNEKIASIGIAIRHWVTYHGASINIGNESLDNFKLIRPCGLDITMTSVEKILNKKIIYDKIKTSILNIIRRFCDGQSIFTGIR